MAPKSHNPMGYNFNDEENNTRLFINQLLQQLRENELGMFKAEEIYNPPITGVQRNVPVLKGIWHARPLTIIVETGEVYIRVDALCGPTPLDVNAWTYLAGAKFAAATGVYFDVYIPAERQEDIAILAAVIYNRKKLTSRI